MAEPVSDLDVECQSWEECAVAFASGAASLRACIELLRGARDEGERDAIRATVHGFCRRLSLVMLAVAIPGSRGDK